MKYFRNLKLRTKLILSFVFIALVVIALTFIFPQFSVNRLTEQSVPFLDLTGRATILGSAIQREILEYVNRGQADSAEEFDEYAQELQEVFAELDEKSAGLIDANDLGMLEEAMNELVSTGQTVITAHNETLALLAQLETAERTLKSMHAGESALNTDEGQELLHQVNETVRSLQLGATKYVLSGEEETLTEFSNHETEFQQHQRTVIPALRTAEPDAAEFVDGFDEVTGRMATISRAVIDSHSETLAGMRNLDRLEVSLEGRLNDMEDVAAREIETSQSELRINFIVSAVLVLLLAVGIGLLATRGIVTPVDRLSQAARWIGAGDLSVRAEVDSRDEIGQLAQVFNQMAGQLQRAFALAEQQNQRRIQELEVTADISRQLTTMLDVDQVLQYVVNQIQRAFGYYHVHIYLTDSTTGELVMREGSGDVGQQLKARGHRLQPGQGIVGQVANSAQALLVSNVDDMPDYVRNPLLPKTQSELAVPLRKGALVLGVLDMQSEELSGFDDEDLKLMQTIADQVAVVVDNARLFRQTRQAVAEAETLSQHLTMARWSDISQRASTGGYVFTKSEVKPVAPTLPTDDEEAWLPMMRQAIAKKELTYQSGENGNDGKHSYLSIPLMLRDQVIGVIGIERSAPEDAAGGTDSADTVLWSDDELTAIQQIAEQITLALDSARLAQETRRAAWRDRLVSESTAQVWATDEIEDVMRAAVEQLGDWLQASEVVIRLGKEDDSQPE